jgi:outer membrane lipoprotein-sorting protein
MKLKFPFLFVMVLLVLASCASFYSEEMADYLKEKDKAVSGAIGHAVEDFVIRVGIPTESFRGSDNRLYMRYNAGYVWKYNAFLKLIVIADANNIIREIFHQWYK